MKKCKAFALTTLVLTYIAMVLLVLIIIFLPFLVTWYVEIKQRSSSLATTVMLTCYPLSPFAGIALYSLSNILRNIIAGNIFCKKNIVWLRRVAYCCLIAAAVMIFAGIFYMPFYIAGAAAGFAGLMSLVFTSILMCQTDMTEDCNEEEEKPQSNEETNQEQ